MGGIGVDYGLKMGCSCVRGHVRVWSLAVSSQFGCWAEEVNEGCVRDGSNPGDDALIISFLIHFLHLRGALIQLCGAIVAEGEPRLDSEDGRRKTQGGRKEEDIPKSPTNFQYSQPDPQQVF